MHDEYIRLQKKPDNLTWDEFAVLAQKQFKIDQENEIKRLKDKKEQQRAVRNVQTLLQAQLDAKKKANSYSCKSKRTRKNSKSK